MSLNEYLNSIGRVPLLSANEEIILGIQVQKMLKLLQEKSEQAEYTPEEKKIIRAGKRAKDRMISANLRLVVNVAKKFKPFVHMKMEDILQEGNLGLIRAVEKFEPERGYKFSTYAYWWIRQAITRSIESQELEIRIPGHLQKTARLAAESKIKLKMILGRFPTLQEVAEDLNEPSPEKIEYAISCQLTSFSFDSKSAAAIENDYSHILEMTNTDNEQELEEDFENNVKMDLILLAINSLEEEDKLLIKKRYGIEMDQVSVKSIAEERGTSVQAVREKIGRIMNKVKLVVRQFA